MKGNQSILLGQNLLNVVHIDWQSISINTQMDLNKIFEEYKEVFSSNLGVLKREKIKIDVPKNVNPKYFKGPFSSLCIKRYHRM